MDNVRSESSIVRTNLWMTGHVVRSFGLSKKIQFWDNHDGNLFNLIMFPNWTTVPIKGAGRPTRLLPHAKKLLTPIKLFYLLGRLCSGRFCILLSKCGFSRMFHSERSWHIYRLTVVIDFWSAGFALWCKRIFSDLFWSVKLFNYGWIKVPIFSKVPTGSDLSDFL